MVSSSPPSASPWCRAVPRGSACSSRLHIQRTTSKPAWVPSSPAGPRQQPDRNFRRQEVPGSSSSKQLCKDGRMAAHYDVLIVGGGIAGLSLASALAGRCSVALVEAEQELAYHTSSRSARQLIPSYGPPVVQELTVRTLELIAARDAELPEPVLTPRSFLLIGDDATVRAEASGHMQRITHAEAMDLCPALVPD